MTATAVSVTQEVLDHLDGLSLAERERVEPILAEAMRASVADQLNPTGQDRVSRAAREGSLGAARTRN